MNEPEERRLPHLDARDFTFSYAGMVLCIVVIVVCVVVAVVLF